MALEGGNHVSNLTPPTGLEDQELPTETDSDITLADSFVMNNDGLTYLESRKNSPAIENIILDISTIIKETGNILEIFGKGLDELNAPRVIFTQDDELEPTEFV